jgi:hypothetical protein
MDVTAGRDMEHGVQKRARGLGIRDGAEAELAAAGLSLHRHAPGQLNMFPHGSRLVPAPWAASDIRGLWDRDGSVFHDS